MTFVGLAECIIKIYETVFVLLRKRPIDLFIYKVDTLDIINPIDTASLIPDCKRRIQEAEESRIQVFCVICLPTLHLY